MVQGSAVEEEQQQLQLQLLVQTSMIRLKVFLLSRRLCLQDLSDMSLSSRADGALCSQYLWPLDICGLSHRTSAQRRAWGKH